jgi:hypothetical protein
MKELKKVVSQKKEEKERVLSADELIELLKRRFVECQDFAQALAIKTLAPLMLLEKALDTDDAPESLFMKIEDRQVEYCHVGNGAAQILGWTSSAIHKYVEKIDASYMEARRAIDSYRKSAVQPYRKSRA